MLWQHGLERSRKCRPAIAATAALLLATATLFALPTDAGHAWEANSRSGSDSSEVVAAPVADAPAALPAPEPPRQQAYSPADKALEPLPRWVQNVRETVLRSGSGNSATQLSTLPQGSYLQVLGQPENGLLPVYLDGSNTDGKSFGAWVDPADVSASDPPSRITASSRGGSRSVSPDLSTPDKFISVVAEAARDSQQTTGVPASVTIAQAILESDWGKSLLASKAFNFFGIKAQHGPGPAGEINMNTWEVLNGANTVVNAAFKAYHNIFESVEDHGRFLRDNPRYSAAFQPACNAQEFARRINAAGYATDPAYSSKLIGLMDKYNLYQYDIPIP
jgi:hypothetical protein